MITTKVLYDLKVRSKPEINDYNITSIIPKNSRIQIISILGKFFKHKNGWSLYEDENGMLIDLDEEIINQFKSIPSNSNLDKLNEIFLSTNDIGLYSDINKFYSIYKPLELKYPLLIDDLNNNIPYEEFKSNISLEEYKELDDIINHIKKIFIVNFNIVINTIDELIKNVEDYVDVLNNVSISSPFKSKKIKSNPLVRTTDSTDDGTSEEITEEELDDAIDMSFFGDGENNIDKDKVLAPDGKVKNLRGIFGLPYQYDKTVDPSYEDSSDSIGWKYYHTYLVRAPILYLTPVRPKFMPGFSKADKDNMLTAIFNGDNSMLSLFVNEKGEGGRYYSTKFATEEYWSRLNTLCQALSIYLGIGDVKVGNGLFAAPLKSADYREYSISSNVSSVFSGSNTLAYYVDSIDSISETFSNETRTSNLESVLNQGSDMTNEVAFLTSSMSLDKVGDFFTGLMDGLGDVLNTLPFKWGNKIGTTLNSISQGGKLILPEIWSDSKYDNQGGSSFTIKLVSQNPCVLGWFFQVGIPYMTLVNFVASQAINDNAYNSPFLIKGYCRSSLNIDMGIISSMDVKKGDAGKWTVHGLPTEVEISLNIQNLYSAFSTSKSLNDLSSNFFCMDYLANLAGLNINKPSLERSLDLYVTAIKHIFSPSTYTRYLGLKLEEAGNNIAFSVIDWLKGR